MHVYLKLRNGAWMLITKKIEQVTVSSKKRLTRYILAGIAVNGPPDPLNKGDIIKAPASAINKVISRLLDVDNGVAVVVEPLSATHYVIKVPPGKGKIVEYILSEITIKGKEYFKEGKETS